MFNVLEQPWTLIAISIVFYFILQIIRQYETNWWISGLLVILFILILALNRFYALFSPKIKIVVPLAIALLLIYEAALIVRAILIDNKLLWLWVIPIVIAIAGVGLDFFIKTDLEVIRAVIRTGAYAVEEENPSRIDIIISENYRDSAHRSKDSLMSHCQCVLSQPLVEKIVPRIASITVESPTARAVCTSQISFDNKSYVYQNYMRQMLVTVNIELQKQLNNKWLINRVEIVQINMQPASWSNIR
jgi:hypothetical protein